MKAMERLDVLEGHLVARVPSEDDGGQGNAIVDTGAGDSEVKVRGTLLRHIEVGEAAGAPRTSWRCGCGERGRSSR